MHSMVSYIGRKQRHLKQSKVINGVSLLTCKVCVLNHWMTKFPLPIPCNSKSVA